MSLIKTTNADKYFSLCVRERAEWNCERCGKHYEPPTSALHCAHIFSRRHKSIRHYALNAVALCYSCHTWGGGNPVEFTDWIRGYLGDHLMDMLTERKNSPIKYNARLDREIAAHYKEQWEAMMTLRLNGVTGRIDFKSWI